MAHQTLRSCVDACVPSSRGGMPEAGRVRLRPSPGGELAAPERSSFIVPLEQRWRIVAARGLLARGLEWRRNPGRGSRDGTARDAVPGAEP
jgi:hypothetical protein